MSKEEFNSLRINSLLIDNKGSIYKVVECSESSDVGAYSIGAELVDGDGKPWIDLLDSLDSISNYHLT